MKYRGLVLRQAYAWLEDKHVDLVQAKYFKISKEYTKGIEKEIRIVKILKDIIEEEMKDRYITKEVK